MWVKVKWVLMRLPGSGAVPQKANLGNREILFITLTPSLQISVEELSRKLTCILYLFRARLFSFYFLNYLANLIFFSGNKAGPVTSEFGHGKQQMHWLSGVQRRFFRRIEPWE